MASVEWRAQAPNPAANVKPKPLDNSHHKSDLGGGALSTGPASEWLQSPPCQQLDCNLVKDPEPESPSELLLGPCP